MGVYGYSPRIQQTLCEDVEITKVIRREIFSLRYLGVEFNLIEATVVSLFRYFAKTHKW
jgi:hypothetical protein